ncbi:MAG: hypothetical protein R3324_07775 [Halobacteriales archaeon]|nr:hypothetical protein [Halobacteriales archaeon]
MSASATVTDTTRTLLYVLGGVVILALLWFFIINPLLFGDEEEDFTVPSAGGQTEEPVDDGVTGEDDEEEDGLAALPIETYEIFLNRDPFRPVVPAPDDGGAGDGGTDGGDDEGTTPPDDGQLVLVSVDTTADECDPVAPPCAFIRVDDVLWLVNEDRPVFGEDDQFVVVEIADPCVTVSTPDGERTLCEDGPDGDGDGDGDGCTSQDGEVVCDGRVVSVVDVFTEDGQARAVVQVDDQLFEVDEGDVFAENFEVLSIDPPCVTLLFGDDSFTLCEGERVLK